MSSGDASVLLFFIIIAIMIGVYFLDRRKEKELSKTYYGKLKDYEPNITTHIKIKSNTNTTPIKKYYKNNSNDFIDDAFTFLKNIFKFIIMSSVVVGSIALEVVWLGFLFGSIIGCILMLIFFIEGFLLPLILIPLFFDRLYNK